MVPDHIQPLIVESGLKFKMATIFKKIDVDIRIIGVFQCESEYGFVVEIHLYVSREMNVKMSGNLFLVLLQPEAGADPLIGLVLGGG